ncbi:hypothetical protein [Actinomadura sp. 6N118]|uniref:hypothetical protein n=1 Tax=Actinomadura sp. 6N118 TaxID=3375151 RepID=UPI0037AEAFEE
MAIYGWHATFVAVVTAGEGNIARADGLLSQGHAVAVRMGRDASINGTAFGSMIVQARLAQPADATTSASSEPSVTRVTLEPSADSRPHHRLMTSAVLSTDFLS